MNYQFFIIILIVLMVNNSNTTEVKQLPKAIIIGAKKCGTRALLEFISAHPNVSTTSSEVHFFDKFYHMGLDWYRDQMPLSKEHQITIEKTPKYLIDAKVPERVFKMNPNTKLIVVLRNPVTRAISEYVQGQWRKKRQISSYGNESQRFEKMLYDSRTKLIRENWPIIRNGIYVKSIRNWLKYFPLESFLFVNGENLIKQPHIEIEKLQTFLNLKPIIKKEHFVFTSQKKGFPCIMRPLDSKQIKCLSDQKGRKHPDLDDKILNDLTEFYKPFNAELFDLIKQDTPFW